MTLLVKALVTSSYVQPTKRATFTMARIFHPNPINPYFSRKSKISFNSHSLEQPVDSGSFWVLERGSLVISKSEFRPLSLSYSHWVCFLVVHLCLPLVQLRIEQVKQDLVTKVVLIVESCVAKLMQNDVIVEFQGWINTTLMFYAGYPASMLVSDAGVTYNLPLAYLLVGCSYFVCSLFMVVRRSVALRFSSRCHFFKQQFI